MMRAMTEIVRHLPTLLYAVLKWHHYELEWNCYYIENVFEVCNEIKWYPSLEKTKFISYLCSLVRIYLYISVRYHPTNIHERPLFYMHFADITFSVEKAIPVTETIEQPQQNMWSVLLRPWQWIHLTSW